MSDPVIDRTMAVRIATQLGWEPKREWQGLTDDEIKDYWITCMWKIEGTALPIPEFARAIETKLKEKNT